MSLPRWLFFFVPIGIAAAVGGALLLKSDPHNWDYRGWRVHLNVFQYMDDPAVWSWSAQRGPATIGEHIERFTTRPAAVMAAKLAIDREVPA